MAYPRVRDFIARYEASPLTLTLAAPASRPRARSAARVARAA